MRPRRRHSRTPSSAAERWEGRPVAEKLGIGASFPRLTLKLAGGGTLDLPDGLDAKYRVILFYRGHW